MINLKKDVCPQCHARHNYGVKEYDEGRKQSEPTTIFKHKNLDQRRRESVEQKTVGIDFFLRGFVSGAGA